MFKIPENTGVILRDPQPQDDMAGGLSRVVYEERTDGQWDESIPKDKEIQHGIYGDWSTCTNNTCSNSIDTQANHLILNNKIPNDKFIRLERYKFIVNDKFNTSERFNAILSGTNGGQIPGQLYGNYLYKPWDSARNDGMIPESLLTFDPYQRNPVISVPEYFSAIITDEMKEAAQVFKDIFLIQYEIIPTDIASLQYHSKHAPLAIITGVCSPWGEGIIPVCEKKTGHATMFYGWSGTDYLKDFDSYLPNEKKLAWGYNISYAIKGVLLLRDDTKKFKHFFNVQMQFDDRGDEVKQLQLALYFDGVFIDNQLNNQEAIQKFGGYYGENTVRCVKQFQKKYGIDPVGKVGPKTLNKLNQLYS